MRWIRPTVLVGSVLAAAAGSHGQQADVSKQGGAEAAPQLWPEFDHDTPLVECNLPEQFVPRSTWAANLWPGGLVPYVVSSNVTETNAKRLRLAMNELETVANVRFVPRTNETAYVFVQSSTGNNSSVGRIGGMQTLNMVSWSFRYIICHELMHALGMWHEQQRPDRGSYVTINSANIQSGYSGNFSIRSTATVVGPYDFSSVMHYDACAFSTCCPSGSSCGCALSCVTIQALPGFEQFQGSMGNRSSLSQGDKDGLAARYGASVDDAFENNDTIATAAPLGASMPALRLIDTDDYFTFTTGAGSLTISASAGVWSEGNASIVLYSGAGVTLTTRAFVPDGQGASVAVLRRDVTPGTYVLRMTKTQPYGGDYALTFGVTPCDSIDFNGDGVFPDSQDIVDFVLVFAGAACPTGGLCNNIDFNNDGVFPDNQDVVTFLEVFAGGAC